MDFPLPLEQDPVSCHLSPFRSGSALPLSPHSCYCPRARDPALSPPDALACLPLPGLCSLPFSLLVRPSSQSNTNLFSEPTFLSLLLLLLYLNDKPSLLTLKPCRSFYHLRDGQSHLALFRGYFSSLRREEEKNIYIEAVG